MPFPAAGRRIGRRLLALLFAVVLGGCATRPVALDASVAGLPPKIELSATRFFPQERYQCGPAALAMALTAAGIAVSPDMLVPQVYVARREGSLPPEMLAAGRRNGALSMLLPPRLEALLAEVAAGNPVIVLQNLGLPMFPRWHYALVIGYDLMADEVLLRSGTTERLALSFFTFEHTWQRSGRWAMVALAPGRLPASVAQESAAGALIDALVAFEKAGDAGAASLAYRAALGRWPRNHALLMGYGNATYRAGDREAAAEAFRAAVREWPQSVPALNNLASVLSELGRLDEARAAARQAVALGGPWNDAAAATLAEINRRAH